jgi:hypothetical protein
MPVSRLLVEDCLRLNVNKLVHSKTIRYGAINTGVWSCLTWKLHLFDTGTFLEVKGRKWSVVPLFLDGSTSGVRWYILESGKRYEHLLLTPDGVVGTRGELIRLRRLRYGSQRMWTKKSQRAYRRLRVLQRLEKGQAPSLEWVISHDSYLPKKPKWMKQAGYARLRKRLVTTPRKISELEEVKGVWSTEKHRESSQSLGGRVDLVPPSTPRPPIDLDDPNGPGRGPNQTNANNVVGSA